MARRPRTATSVRMVRISDRGGDLETTTYGSNASRFICVQESKGELGANFDSRPRGHVRLVFVSLRVVTGPSRRLRLRSRIQGHSPNEGAGETPRSVASGWRHKSPGTTPSNIRAQGPGLWNFRNLGGLMLPAKWLVVGPLCPGIADIEDLRP